ncbi:flagellar basal body P-ring formation protein FlgA [Microbacterium sp. UMB0228]|uniref:capsid cement protein n=1 Tax=Microbacterium TaxID=33882 RepID=UPI0004688337|nr:MULTISPECIES: capsid cement protein [Microbacterium]PMC04153.1 flagellar basal body P-ring formation protein FlgA [Microbacterium sp. UMB0228]
MAKSYLPLFRPGDTVTFNVTTAVTAGQPVEVGTADMSVAPAAAASAKYVGVAGHDAAVGDKLTVEIGKPIHELKAAGAITRGQKLETAAAGAVRTVSTGDAVFLALTSAADGAPVRAIQL